MSIVEGDEVIRPDWGRRFLQYFAKFRAVSVVCLTVLPRFFKSLRTRLRLGAKRVERSSRRGYAQCYRRAVLMRYSLRRRVKPGPIVTLVTLILIAAITTLTIQALQRSAESYFTGERLAVLRNLLATIEGALVGATAIGFSVVMIAVQLRRFLKKNILIHLIFAQNRVSVVYG